MMRPAVWASASVAGLIGLALLLPARTTGPPPLIVYTAASLRLVTEECAADFTARTGQPVELRVGGSATLLLQARSSPGDVLIPADETYLQTAHDSGLTEPGIPLALMRAVVVARQTVAWDDVKRPGFRLSLAEPDTAAIGRLTRAALTPTGDWAAIRANLVVQPETVTESLTAVQIGAADGAIVWDVVARRSPNLHTFRPEELASVTANVSAAVLHATRNRAFAEEFVSFLKIEGRNSFLKHGFRLP